MDDFVKRSDVLNASKIVYIECLETDDGGYLEADADDIPVILKRDVEAIPAADVVEVVRCRDCTHRDPADKKCDCGGLERAGCIFSVDDDYFCAFGERMDGGVSNAPD